MKRIFDSYKNSGHLHHAYFLVGNTGNILAQLNFFLQESLGIKVRGSADFWHGKFHNMTVEEAKELFRLSQNRNFNGGKKFFILETDFITEEAQSSMLKFFEEPTLNTHFFIISPQDNLLPTLKSRVITLRIDDLQNNDALKSRILTQNLAERISLVKEVVDSIRDEESTKQRAIELLNEIESALYKEGVEKNFEKLQICQKTRASLYDRGATVKIALENLMILI